VQTPSRAVKQSYSSVIAAVQSGFFPFIQSNDYTLEPFLLDNSVFPNAGKNVVYCSQSFSGTMRDLFGINTRCVAVFLPCLQLYMSQLAWVGMCQQEDQV